MQHLLFANWMSLEEQKSRCQNELLRKNVKYFLPSPGMWAFFFTYHMRYFILLIFLSLESPSHAEISMYHSSQRYKEESSE
jgi:hypothetical protein